MNHRAEIAVIAYKTEHQTVDQYYDSFTDRKKDLVKEKKELRVSGQKALQITSKFESEEVETVLIKDGVFYSIVFYYPNYEVKRESWEIYSGMLDLFKLP